MIKQCCKEKAKLDTVDVQVFKTLINSYISHDEFVSVKKKSETLKNAVEYTI